MHNFSPIIYFTLSLSLSLVLFAYIYSWCFAEIHTRLEGQPLSLELLIYPHEERILRTERHKHSRPRLQKIQHQISRRRMHWLSSSIAWQSWPDRA